MTSHKEANRLITPFLPSVVLLIGCAAILSMLALINGILIIGVLYWTVDHEQVLNLQTCIVVAAFLFALAEVVMYQRYVLKHVDLVKPIQQEIRILCSLLAQKSGQERIMSDTSTEVVFASEKNTQIMRIQQLLAQLSGAFEPKPSPDLILPILHELRLCFPPIVSLLSSFEMDHLDRLSTLVEMFNNRGKQTRNSRQLSDPSVLPVRSSHSSSTYYQTK